jgi:hypothetical protein
MWAGYKVFQNEASRPWLWSTTLVLLAWAHTSPSHAYSKGHDFLPLPAALTTPLASVVDSACLSDQVGENQAEDLSLLARQLYAAIINGESRRPYRQEIERLKASPDPSMRVWGERLERLLPSLGRCTRTDSYSGRQIPGGCTCSLFDPGDGNQYLLTAAHCVYAQQDDGCTRPATITFAHAFDNGQHRGAYEVKDVVAAGRCSTWQGAARITHLRPNDRSTKARQEMDQVFLSGAEDWAVLKLDRPIPGAVPLRATSASRDDVTKWAPYAIMLPQYPHSFGGTLVANFNCGTTSYNRDSDTFSQNCDATDGTSGSPALVYHASTNSWQIIGVMVSSPTGGNTKCSDQNGDRYCTNITVPIHRVLEGLRGQRYQAR